MEDIIANGSCLIHSVSGDEFEEQRNRAIDLGMQIRELKADIVISHIVQEHFHLNLLQSFLQSPFALTMRSLLRGGERLIEQTQNIGDGSGFGEIPSMHSAYAAHAREEVLTDGETGWLGQQVFRQEEEDELSRLLQFPIDDLVGNFYLDSGTSPGASTASGCGVDETTPPVHKQNLSNVEGKRPILSNAEGKRRDRTDGNDCQSDDDDLVLQVKKNSPKPTSLKRPRAAEVHKNLSERKQRDRLRIKLKELQKLIPPCKKVDKVSILDEAIKYLKSLQLKVQIFENMGGSGMVPMMYQGAQQQYIAAMGMGMDMGAMNQLGFPLQSAAAGPSFPVPSFPMPPVPVPPTTAGTPPVSIQHSLPVQPVSNQPRLSTPSVVDYYQHLTAPPQVPIRSRSVVLPSINVPSSSGDAWNSEK